MNLRRSAACAAAMMCLALPAAQAATVTLNSWTWGNGNNVNASAPAYSGAAGGFSGTLSGSGIPGLDGSIETYCVELAETFSFGTAYSNYTVMSAASYFGAAKATTLGRLISHVFDTNLFGTTAAGFKDNLSTALQLAIWNVVYDTDTTLDSGAFSDTSTYRSHTSDFLGANQLFTNSAGQPISYELYVLSSGKPINSTATNGRQDQLFWRPAPQRIEVPEPGSLALALGALGAAGFVARSRKAAAAAR